MEFENKKLRSVADAAARIMMGEKALHPNQQKLDVHEPEKDKLTSDDFKKLRSMKKEETMHEESCGCGACPSKKDMKKEEVDLDEGKMGQLSADLKDMSHADFIKEYGKPKHHYDPNNFKKPVKPGKEMDRAKSLAQRAMASMKKEEVEDLSEATYVVKHDGVADNHADADAKKLFAGKTNVNSHVSRYASSAEKHADMLKSKGFKNVRIQTMNKEEVELDEMFPGTPEYEKKYGKAPQDMKKGEKKKTTQGEMEKTEKGVVHKRKFSEMVESYTEGGVKGLFKTLAEEPTSAEFDAQLDDAKKRAAGTKKQPEVSKPAVQAVQNEEIELTLEDFTPEELEEFMQTEEYEQLDELSKATLGSYVKKASKDVQSKAVEKEKYIDNFARKRIDHSLPRAKEEVAKKKEKINNRQSGIGKAVDRMTKEGVESFEEQTHTTVEFIDYNDVNGVKYTEIDLEERKLTDAETEKKEDTVKSMKKNLSGFKERYGKDAKSVMYATATKQAKGE